MRRGWVVGAYVVPLYPGIVLVEAAVRDRADLVDLAHFAPYRPAVEDSEIGIGTADFYLSEDGEELIGSYLDLIEEAVPWDAERNRPRAPDTCLCRFVIVMEYGQLPAAFYTPWGTLRVPRTVPVPSRLLRLIWIDEERVNPWSRFGAEWDGDRVWNED